MAFSQTQSSPRFPVRTVFALFVEPRLEIHSASLSLLLYIPYLCSPTGVREALLQASPRPKHASYHHR